MFSSPRKLIFTCYADVCIIIIIVLRIYFCGFGFVLLTLNYYYSLLSTKAHAVIHTGGTTSNIQLPKKGKKTFQ